MADYSLCVDIGNTNTVFGIFEDGKEGEPLFFFRSVTRTDTTSDELAVYVRGFMNSSGIEPKQIKHFTYSSVVPSFNPIVERMAEDTCRISPLRVTWNMPLPLTYEYPNPFEIGADRIVNAVSSVVQYGGDNIIVDLGTATTFCVVHQNAYLGGAIAPGLKMSMDALHQRTAQLPPIEFHRPLCGIIGDSTVSAIQSGFFFGWIGMLREILNEIKRAYPDKKYRVVATGGLSNLIHKETGDLFNLVDTHLTLKGLRFIQTYRP